MASARVLLVTAFTLVLGAACDESGDVARLEQRIDKLEQELEATRAARDRGDDEAVVLNRKLDVLSKELEATQKKLELLEGVARTPTRPSYKPRPQPDPKLTYAVPVDDSPSDGPRRAKVTIVAATEFACPYCFKARDTLAALRKHYGNDLRIVYKQFVIHPQIATTPALAACAAHKQGKYLEMAEALWTGAYQQRKFDEAYIVELARDAGLNMSRFEDALHGADCKAELARDHAQLTAVGVAATPTFFINGRYMSGAQPFDAFGTLIDEELAKADRAIAGGIDQGAYYEHLVQTGVPRFVPDPTAP